jgi:hypothetical protein
MIRLWVIGNGYSLATSPKELDPPHALEEGLENELLGEVGRLVVCEALRKQVGIQFRHQVLKILGIYLNVEELVSHFALADGG